MPLVSSVRCQARKLQRRGQEEGGPKEGGSGLGNSRKELLCLSLPRGNLVDPRFRHSVYQ